MSSQSQSQWFRTAFLIVSTLAVVGVLFAIYIQYSRTEPATLADTVPIHDPRPLPGPATRPTPTTAPASSPNLRVGGVSLDRGGKIKLNLYAREGTEARLELVVDAFQATDKSENELQLERPVIRFRTPSGQVVRVEADKGLVELTRQRGESYDMARGKLTGQVRVLMDRFTREQRAQLPPEKQDELTEDRLIKVELDDLTFDLEYARVESAGRVFASLAEAEFEGRGLLLRYDEGASRIEHLKIAQGGHITLRRLGTALAIGLPGPGPGTAAPNAAAVATSAPASKPAVEAVAQSRTPVDEQGVPYFVPDAAEKQPRIREMATYHASFERDVVVDQFEGRTQVGLLSSDQLEFLFDFGQRQREQAARLTSTSRPAGAATREAGGVAENEHELVVMRWKGPLVVDLVRDEMHKPAEGAEPRRQITARGREVYVADRRGNARCRKLVHHQETKRLWLQGDAEAPLVLDLGDTGQLTGREVYWDGSGNTVTVSGPGRLTEGRAGVSVRRAGWGSLADAIKTAIAFEDEMKLCLGTQVEETVDALTSEIIQVDRQSLQSAVLLGKVVMAQGADSVAGDRVEVAFGPPLRPGSFADNLQSLKVDGNVLMVQGEDRITCDTMDVALGPDPSGRIAPTRGVAVGHVWARQGSRAIAARDRMIVELQPRRTQKPPFDLVQAKVIATQRGLKVEEIDWPKRRDEYEREDRYEPGLRHLQAYGAVRVEDPGQGLAIDAGELDCGFKDGRQIEKGQVIGEGAQPASVAFGDFGIMGQKVDFDAAMQWAEVPGAGRLSFLSRQDLDGRAVDKPIPTAITWNQRMSFRGRENKAIFTGAVHAVSETSSFDCRAMALDFVDDEEIAAVPASTISPMDWWILRPWTAQARKHEQRELEAPPFRRKQVAYLTATGDVVALTAAYEVAGGFLKSRTRLAGPQLAVDLRNQTQTLTMDDAGTLLIEDYELKSGEPSAALTKTSPFGAEGGNLPSQTFMSWQGSMSYYSASRLAVFEKEVEMAHRSGAKLILAEGVLSESAMGEIKESGKGRDARLSCRQLNVQFRGKADGDRSRVSQGLGGMSGNEVASFAARGDVYFEDSGISVTSRSVTFDRQRNLLQILGSAQAPAELIDLRGERYRSIKGPTIYWERDTNQIEAPGSTIRSR